MTEIHCPHDKLFKNIMGNQKVAIDFFKNYLPEKILKEIDLNELEICKNTYVSKILKETSSDLLFKTKIAGEIGYIYLLCEHQSKVDQLMALRVLEYIILIWRDHLKIEDNKPLPLVIPIVFYHGTKVYDGCKDIRDLINAPRVLVDEFLFGPFHLIDTHTIEDDVLNQQQLLGFFIFVLKNIFIKNFREQEATFIDMLSNLLNFLDQNDIKGSENINTLLFYVLEVGQIHQTNDFIKHIHQQLPSKLGGEFMTGAEYLRQEGEKRGVANMLLKQLQRKFGFLPPSYCTKIENANAETINIWADRILFANSLQQIFDETVIA